MPQIEQQLADARRKAARPVKGAVTGTRHGGEAYAKAEAIAPGAGWTRWLGSDGTMHGQDSGRSLCADLRKGRLVWRCEQDLLPGKGQVTRYGGFDIYYKKPSGGGSSPVVGDGRVYLYYYVPSGQAYLKEEEEKRAAKGCFLKDMWRLRADDVVICIDAATGRTLALQRHVAILRGGSPDPPRIKAHFRRCAAGQEIYPPEAGPPRGKWRCSGSPAAPWLTQGGRPQP